MSGSPARDAAKLQSQFPERIPQLVRGLYALLATAPAVMKSALQHRQDIFLNAIRDQSAVQTPSIVHQCQAVGLARLHDDPLGSVFCVSQPYCGRQV